MDDRCLSVKEVTEYLGIRRETLYKWIARKAMPCVRIGREWRFKKDEIDGWLRSGRAAKSETETAVARTGED